MPSFKEINFRYTDARSEKIYSPEVLQEAFVDLNQVMSEIFRPDKFIVYGPKGSGKTAIGAYLELWAQQQATWFMRLEELDDFDFSVLSFHDEDRRSRVDLKGWRFVLLVRLIALMINDEALQGANPELARLAEDLRAHGILPSTNLTVLAERTLGRKQGIKFNLFAEIGAEGERSTTNEGKSPDKVADALLLLIEQLRPTGGKYVLIIDGLDYVLRDGDDRVYTIGDLIQAARSINETLVRVGIDGKILVLLRDEIARLIPSPDLSKRLNDHGIYLNWYHNYRDPFGNDLLKIIERRAHMVGFDGTIEQLWKAWFPKKIGNLPSAQYIIGRTRILPRDIISFFRCLQKLEEPPFTFNAVMSAEQRHSEWMFEEMSDALVGLVPSEVKQAINGVLRDVGRVFTVGDLGESLKKRALSTLITPEALAKTLFETHWIGNVWVTDNGHRAVVFHSRARNVAFSPERRCVLHLGVAKGLKLDLD